jgi:glycosyltransferase involved in cell wall biosynthesis
MRPIPILVDTLADKGLTNAQMGNAREIIRRLDPEFFPVSAFHIAEPDPLFVTRPNTRLIRLPKHLQTLPILREFILGPHRILFYVKSSPASKWYLRSRRRRHDERITIATIESRSDLRRESTITSEASRLWEQTVLRCDYLFSNSSAVQQSLRTEYGLGSGLVPTGVDTRFFTPAPDGLRNVRPRVLFVGSLRPFKQPQLLLDAAQCFQQADFVLAGDGPMAAELRNRVQFQGLRNVILVGPLQARDLRLQYQQSDIFLFPSSWEGSPKVILEAAACGLPVIARNDYQPETVIDGQTGYLVSSNDELFARLADLLNSLDLRRNLGAAGRKHIERFDWDHVASCWQEIFISLVSNARCAGAA